MNCIQQTAHRTLHFVVRMRFCLASELKCGNQVPGTVDVPNKNIIVRDFIGRWEMEKHIDMYIEARALSRFWIQCLFIANNNDRLGMEYAQTHAHSFSSLYTLSLYVYIYFVKVDMHSQLFVMQFPWDACLCFQCSVFSLLLFQPKSPTIQWMMILLCYVRLVSYFHSIAFAWPFWLHCSCLDFDQMRILFHRVATRKVI